MSADGTVLVGDAKGADLLVQEYLNEKRYSQVNVYASGRTARHNLGGWPVVHVSTEEKRGTFNYYVAKDKKMAEDADYGMMIWDGRSKGTLNDMIMLSDQEKTVLVYYLPINRFVIIRNHKTLTEFISLCGKEASDMFSSLLKTSGRHFSNRAAQSSNKQISLFDNA
jgi:hypothetical protein